MIDQIQVSNYDWRSIVNDNRMQISGLPNNKWKAVISQAKNCDGPDEKPWLTSEAAIGKGRAVTDG